MTKQEEIREEVWQVIRRSGVDIFQADDLLEEILRAEDKLGVVIKVDRIDSCDDCPHNHHDYGTRSWGGRPSDHCDLLFQLPKGCHKFTTNEAGYGAFEPLIKEVSDG